MRNNELQCLKKKPDLNVCNVHIDQVGLSLVFVHSTFSKYKRVLALNITINLGLKNASTTLSEISASYLEDFLSKGRKSAKNL